THEDCAGNHTRGRAPPTTPGANPPPRAGPPPAPHPPLIPPQGGLPMLPRCARSLAVRSIACVLFLAGVSWICADEPEKLPPIVAQVLKGHAETVYAVAYTPDGRQVITASFDKT